MSVAGKLIEMKIPPENLSITSERRKTSTNSSVRHCFQQRAYWSEWDLVISLESPGSSSSSSIRFERQYQKSRILKPTKNRIVCEIPRSFERSNLQIFELKVLLSVLTEKFSNATFVRQIASQNLQRKNLGFSETEKTAYRKQKAPKEYTQIIQISEKYPF